MARTNQALIRRQPSLGDDLFWGPWSDLLRDFDDAFDTSGPGWALMQRPTSRSHRLSPTVDISENDDGYLLSFDLPGLKKEDIDIEVKSNSLTVSGVRNYADEVKRDNYRRIERQYGEFRREFSLPENVKADAIECTYENGVLHVAIPKAELSKPRKIPINERAGLLKKIFAADKDHSKEAIAEATGK